MKIRIMSDLHLESAKFKVPELPGDQITTLILAGDINVGCRARQWIESLCDRFRHVVYVPGNHEFYNNDVDDVISRWKTAPLPKNFSFLCNDTVVVGDVTIHGTPLWSDFEGESWFSMEACRCGISDFEITRFDNKRYSPAAHLFLFNQAKKFLTNALLESEGRTVVVTHFLPSMCLVADQFSTSTINGFYASNLDQLIPYADLWVHGHTHVSHDRMLGDTRVVCNPRGYIPYEPNMGFDPNLVVEV